MKFFRNNAFKLQVINWVAHQQKLLNGSLSTAVCCTIIRKTNVYYCQYKQLDAATILRRKKNETFNFYSLQSANSDAQCVWISSNIHCFRGSIYTYSPDTWLKYCIFHTIRFI